MMRSVNRLLNWKALGSLRYATTSVSVYSGRAQNIKNSTGTPSATTSINSHHPRNCILQQQTGFSSTNDRIEEVIVQQGGTNAALHAIDSLEEENEWSGGGVQLYVHNLSYDAYWQVHI